MKYENGIIDLQNYISCQQFLYLLKTIGPVAVKRPIVTFELTLCLQFIRVGQQKQKRLIMLNN